MRRSWVAWIPARYLSLVWIVGLFLAINGIVRIGLTAFARDPSNLLPWRFAGIVSVGALYGFAAVAYVLVPFGLLALLCGKGARGRVAHAALFGALVLAALFGALFTAVAEGLFWNEFGTRFNFIAVDYLVYTREVIGNIRQSYPVGLLIAAIIVNSMSLTTVRWLVVVVVLYTAISMLRSARATARAEAAKA